MTNYRMWVKSLALSLVGAGVLKVWPDRLIVGWIMMGLGIALFIWCIISAILKRCLKQQDLRIRQGYIKIAKEISDLISEGNRLNFQVNPWKEKAKGLIAEHFSTNSEPYQVFNKIKTNHSVEIKVMARIARDRFLGGGRLERTFSTNQRDSITYELIVLEWIVETIRSHGGSSAFSM